MSKLTREDLILLETGGGTDTVSLRAPVDISTSYPIVLPGSQGLNNSTLVNNGSGNLNWISSILTTYEKVNVNSPSYTATIDKNFIMVDYTVTGACTVTLPIVSSIQGINYEIIDSGGNAHFNYITVNCDAADTISGGSSVIISENYNSVSLFNDSTNKWFIY